MWRDYVPKNRSKRSSTATENLERSRKFVLFAKLGFIGIIALVGLFLIAIPIMSVSLPSPDKVVRREGFSTKILDRNGKELYDIFVNQRQTPVAYEDIPIFLQKATIAVEDKDFYSHPGFDIKGILRGLSRQFTRGRAQGGSTLTQQLVKNVLLTDERSVIRKVKEFVLAIEIESKYSKNQILQMYLNEAPYGGNTRGVEAASEMYFGKNVKDLNLIESAFLAGLPQSPSYYSPFLNSKKAYVDRTKVVLRRMREDSYINAEQEKQGLADLENLTFQARDASFKAPHFVQYVQKILESRYGENKVEQGGLTVTTTLDLDLQEKAQQIVTDEIAKIEKLHITNGSTVVINPQTGEILAMVGSKNFNAKDYDGQFNVATQGLRQPGSTMKPFTYVTGFKKGYTPSTLFMDVPTTFPGGIGQPDYNPVNYDGKFRGPIQLRYALGNSINIPAVKMIALVGIKDVLQTAYDQGVTTLEPTKENLAKVGLSLTLGGGEVHLLDITDAYAPFMNSGYKVDPISVLKVVDRDGTILENITPEKGKRVLSEEQSFLIADILSDSKAREQTFGQNSILNVSGRKIAVKTGTTNDKRDNWTIGGDGQMLVGVWVGNNDFTQMLQVASGVTGASPIWRKVLDAALNDKPVFTFQQPSNLVTADVDLVSGYKAHDGFPSRQEFFIRGTEPQEDPVHVKLKICRNEGKLATPADVAANNYDDKEYFVFKEEDPLVGTDGKNRWQEAILNWLNTQTDSKYHPPTDYCGTSNPLNVDFVTPNDRNSNLPNDFKIKVRADSTNDIALVDIEIDGTKVRSFSSLPYEFDTHLSDGVHTIRAVAYDSKSHQSDRRITVGVNTAWDANQQTPSPSPVGFLIP